MHWSQLLVRTIESRWNHCSHYFALDDKFSKQVIASVELGLHITQKVAQRHFRVIVTTQNSLRLTRTQG